MPSERSISDDFTENTHLKVVLDQIIRVCDANHRLIVLTTGFMKFMTPNNPTVAFHHLPSFLAAHGVPFLEISGELAAATRDNLEDYVIPVNRHPDEKGDALVAALIWSHLRGPLLESTNPQKEYH